MDINLDDVIVRDNTTANRYEARIGDHLAVMTYVRAPGQITFMHTVVPPALAGHGIADKMARTVLEEARAAGLADIPRCPFVTAYIQRHPEYIDLVRLTSGRAPWAGRHVDRSPYGTLWFSRGIRCDE